MAEEKHQIALESSIQAQTESHLTIAYRVENRSDSDVFLFNRLYSQRMPDGSFALDPNMVYIKLQDDQAHLAKWVPEVPDDINVMYPVIPCATLLTRDARFTEELRLPLPLTSLDPYDLPEPSSSDKQPVTYRSLLFSLGYFRSDELNNREVSRVATNLGEAFYLVVTAPSQRVVSSLISPGAFPVITKSSPRTLEGRTCSRCGSANLGSQTNCLICQAPLNLQEASRQPQPLQPSIKTQPQTQPQLCANPACRQPLRPGRGFCGRCGQRVIAAALAPPRGCPRCGETAQAGEIFCSACGSNLPR